MVITGERVTTNLGGFNPAWQRHVAAYAQAAKILGPGSVLDLGCGIGHSYHLLAPRRTVGVDIDSAALAGQDRETHVADMRALPFPNESFTSVLSVQSLEHVKNPEAVVAEAYRVLEPGGTAIFVTPNRLNFGRPDEIIDPYHYVEYDAGQLHEVCSRHFASVTVHGLFGSSRHLAIHRRELKRLDDILRLDPLRLRRLVPRIARMRLYDLLLTRNRRDPDPASAAITPDDFDIREDRIDECLDLFAVCRKPVERHPDTAHESARAVHDAKGRGSVMVVMPAYNAEATLRAVHDGLLPGIVDKVLVVDDASTDGTLKVAQSLGLQTIAHPHNVGYGGNQKTCYLEALRQDAAVVVMLHPDGQYDPGFISRLVSAVRDEGADVVLGSRMMVPGMARAGGMPLWKRVVNRLLTGAQNAVLRQRLSEYHTGYRAYSRHFLRTVPFMRNSNDFVFDSEILVQAIHFGFRIVELPVSSRYHGDASSVGLKDGTVYGLKTLAVLMRYLLHRRGMHSRLFES